jgi:Zn-finger protein
LFIPYGKLSRTPKYLDNGIKDCSDCLFPHDPENYDKIIEILKEKR